MPERRAWTLVGLAIVLCAAALRLVALDARPFHGDEAANSVRFAGLWERGEYRYDPFEHHGPTLPYLTLPLVWLSGAESFADTDESIYRAVAALLGIGLVALTLLTAKDIGRTAALIASASVAVSAAMTYYSRYYIHEIALVFFTFGALLAGIRTVERLIAGESARGPAIAWGASLGLMHATKETAVIAYLAMAVGALFTARFPGVRGSGLELLRRPAAWRALGLAALAALASSALLFSSFLDNPRGPLDSILTYAAYLERGAGGQSLHDHAWHWYLSRIVYTRRMPTGPWWSEGVIVLLSILGLAAGLLRSGVEARFVPAVRFFGIYTLVLVVVYSAIPYKTPWCVLSFLHGMAILAGVGAVALLRWLPAGAFRVVAVLMLAVAGGHLLLQTWRASFDLHSTTLNPWVYAHPSESVRELSKRAEELTAVHPARLRGGVRVVSDENVWPLPFYLRRLRDVRYYFVAKTMPEPATQDPALLIGTVAVADRYRWSERQGYAGPELFPLRPGVLLALYVRDDLLETFEGAPPP